MHASAAIDFARPEQRRRDFGTLLVVGDEGAQGILRAARSGWTVATVDTLSAMAATKTWHQVLIDPAVLDQVRDRHPEILRTARRVWVVPPHAPASDAAVTSPENPLPLGGRLVKRALDILLALVGLLLVLPVLLVAMVAVRLDSSGPALFKQVRVGVNGRRFRLYKVRTMRNGNDDRGHREYVARLIAGSNEQCDGVYKLAHDPRITSVGRFLRHYSLDELPQLWNVLKGDMSLVGPRPALPHETELYPAHAWARLRVKPGVTGLWQVSGRSELSFDDMVSLDLRYWQQWTLLSDIVILLKTPGTVLSGKGAA